ncbi:hypothetical protein QBC45DRAFT_467846 [Copromyces sp. CBS 386.78]|nr:hypothetical protein QBC45DRAFT_467846 [Copromyces sp. CBS 386.78]
MPPESNSKIPAPQGNHVARKRQEKPTSATASLSPLTIKTHERLGEGMVLITAKKAKAGSNTTPQQGEDKPPAAAAADEEEWVYVDQDEDWVLDIPPPVKKEKQEDWTLVVPVPSSRELGGKSA